MRLAPLTDVLGRDGPFVTVHAEVGRATADAESQIGARTTNVRNGLERAEVTPALVNDIIDRIGANPHLPGLVRRTIVADTESVVFDELQPGHHPWGELVDRGALPQFAPWIAAEEAGRRVLLLTVDRVGADLSVHHTTSEPAETETSVEGEDFHVSKVREGDLAHKQIQQNAEDAWTENARQVADEARALAREHGVRATLVAGETRARAEVMRALEQDAASLGSVIEIESGGRDSGASDTALWDEVAARVGEMARTEDSEVTALLDEAVGRGEGAALGLQDVVAALDQSRVERLLIDPARLGDGVGVPTEGLTGIPLPASARAQDEVPADRALVAAAALTGASLTVLPQSMTHGGPAALLRWD